MNYNKQHYTPILFSKNLIENKPMSVLFQGKPVVLFRTNNTISAYEDFCPHRGLALSEGFIQDGQIHCKYHGWSFNCDDGNNTFVPVKNKAIPCQLKAILIREAFDILWLSDAKNAVIPDLFHQKSDILLEGKIKAKLTNTLENFLEGSHTHFVHDGLIRSQKSQRNEIKGKLISNESGFKVYYESEPAKGIVTQLLPKKWQELSSVSTYIHPSIAILEYFNPQGELISRFEAIFKEEERETQYFARIFIQLGKLTPFIRFFAKNMFTKIIEQDKKILESQEENLSFFKENKFVSDETDVVGKYLFYWANNKNEILEKEVDFNVFW